MGKSKAPAKKSKGSAAKKSVKLVPPKHRAMKAQREAKELKVVKSVGLKLKDAKEKSVKQKPVNHTNPNKVSTRIRAPWSQLGRRGKMVTN